MTTSVTRFAWLAHAPLLRVAVVLSAVLGGLLVAPAAASAHPLGNATVNHYDGLHLYTDHVDDTAVEDVAEIPTVQRKGDIDTNGDGTQSDAERAAYAARQCAAMVGGKTLTVGSVVVPFSVLTSTYSEKPGQAGLTIGELYCTLRASVQIDKPETVKLATSWDSAGIGWHEITAVADGVALQNSPVPATSISGELQAYPVDTLASPLDVRSATLQVTPDGTSTYASLKKLPVAGYAVRKIADFTKYFNTLYSGRLTFGVGLLTIVLAMLLGAGHAFLPGHGKTIMAAYLVGKRGRLRDVVLVGATVTLTHTLGVLVIGAAISLSAAFAPTAVLQDLSVLSGALVMAVGVGLLITAYRRRGTAGADIAEGFARAVAVPVGESEEVVKELAAVGAAVASTSGGHVLHEHVGSGDGGHHHEHGNGHSHEDHAHQDHAHAHDGHVHEHHDHDHDGHVHSHDGHEHAPDVHEHSHADHAHPHADHAHPHDGHEHSHDGHVHADHVHAHAHGPAAHTHSHEGHAHADHAHAGHANTDHSGDSHDDHVHPHDHADHDHDHDHADHDHGEHTHGAVSRMTSWFSGAHSHGPDGHSHGPRGHSHEPVLTGGTSGSGFSRVGLVGLGAAGGLVPSPSALLVLLGTIALNRTIFGVVLVLFYGLGMALALTSAGLLFVSLQARLARLASKRGIGVAARYVGALPVLTAVLVLFVGALLVARALAGNV